MFSAVLVLFAASFAAISDVRTRRIPNALVLALFAGGLLLNVLAGWQHALADLGVTIAVLLGGSLLFAMRIIGGGDIKLLAAAAGALGYPGALGFIVYTLLCGGLIAVAYAAIGGRLRATFENVRTIALPVFAGVAPVRLQNGTQMPYALAIFAGALLTVLASALAPHVRFPWSLL